MKITKKSFQSFFTRASFAGLLLVAGASAAQARATADAPAKEDNVLSEFTFERIFSWSVPVRKSWFYTEAASWSAPAVVSGGQSSPARPSSPDDALGSTFATGLGALPSFSSANRIAPTPSATVLTSGTLTSTLATYNYSTAPWVLSTGDGPYPDLGGTATFAPVLGSTSGTVGPTTTVTIDVSPMLSQINFNSPIQYILAAGTGTSIIAPTTGLTINSVGTATNVSVGGVAISAAFGSQIASAISGGGTAGVTKTGSGNAYLLGTNTYTGGTHFNGGVLTIGGAATVGDAVFGATGAGNGLSFNGGSVLFATTGGLTTTRDIFIDTGGANFQTNTATTLGGNINGSGPLTTSTLSAVVLTLTGANTFTGSTTVRGPVTSNSGAVALTLSGNGALASSSSYDLTGLITLDNSGTNITNRLSDTSAMTLRGVRFVDTGNASAPSSETIGAVTANNGFSTFVVTPGSGQANSLTMASLARANGSTLDFRGAGLGGTPGANVSNIFITTAPALTGGGGAAGTTTQSIIPYAIGNLGAGTAFTAAAQVGSSFVTYGATGVRPLATSEYATAFGGNVTDNVLITDGTTQSPTVATANAVLLAPATAAASALSGTINITSGAFLYSPTVDSTGTVSANLNFGTAQGVVTTTSALTLSGVLAGTNGLVISTATPPSTNYTPNLFLTGANTYTGNTTINAGTVGFSGTTGAGNAGAFGPSGTVVLNAGTTLAAIAPTALTTLGNNISVIGNGANYLAPSTSGFITTVTGNIALAGNLNIEGYTSAAASAINLNGVISGTGTLTDAGYNYLTLNGANTYSGGTIFSGASASTFFAATNTAFGTGTIIFNVATTTLAGVGTTAVTLANNLFLNNTPIFGGTAPLTLTGGVNLNGSRTISVTDTALTTFTGVLSSGAVIKTGTGPVAFNSTTGSTYTGGTVLGANVGSLYGNNTSGSAFGTGAVSIGATSATTFSTLAGAFTTSGATSIAGRLSPGNGPGLTSATAGIGSIGQISFGSTLSLSSSTTSSLYLEAAGPGTSTANFDRITVTGAFTLNGTIFFATTNGYTIQSGDSYTVATATGGITQGTFTFNTTGATLGSGVTLNTVVGTNSIVITAVPEPGTWAAVLGGLGVLGSVQFARRRRNRGA